MTTIANEAGTAVPPIVGLVVPTLNAGPSWTAWLDAYAAQTCKPAHALVIDSSSSDETVLLARQRGFEVKVIRKSEFNHGGTRQSGVEAMPDASIIIFLTQDAILAGPDSLARLIRAFDDAAVGAAYGRQLPHADASPLGAHARIFNYRPDSYTRSRFDVSTFGIKSAFFSNSFSAYRASALKAMGGFPDDLIMNEDTYVVGKMILSDWKVSYVADSTVYHSHNYSLLQDFKRYFDHGVFFSRQPWMRTQFGRAEGEGARFVRSELSFLKAEAPLLIPSALFRTAFKYLGYRLGLIESRLGAGIKKKLSMHKAYWNQAGPPS